MQRATPKIAISQTCSRKCGFTLVETVIAMALFSLIIAGSFALLIHSYSTMRRTQETLYVNRVLESALEMTRNLNFDELVVQASNSPINFSTDSSLLPLYGKINDTVDDSGFQMDLDEGTGSIIIEQLNSDLCRVTANVTWKPYRLDEDSRSIATYISRNGINRR